MSAAAAERDQWLELRSAPFVVVSNAGEERAREMSEELGRARSVFQRLLEGVRLDPREPIVVVAVKDEDSLRELLPQLWERRSRRPVAAYWTRPHEHHVVLRVNTSAAERSRHVFHEYVHLLTHVNVPDSPAWLDEGLSELWGTTVVSDEAVEVGWPPAHHLKALRQRGSWIPPRRAAGNAAGARRARFEAAVDVLRAIVGPHALPGSWNVSRSTCPCADGPRACAASLR